MSTPRCAARIAAGSIAVLALVVSAQAGAVRADSARLTKRAPAAAASGNPYTFAGPTTQFPCQMNTDNIFCGTVNVFMSKDMKRVKRLLLGFEATCQAPDTYFGTNLVLTGLPAKKGRKGSSFKAAMPVESPLADGLTARAQVAVAGKAKLGWTGQGSFQISIGIFDGSGAQIDTCTTGHQTFRLKALRRR